MIWVLVLFFPRVYGAVWVWIPFPRVCCMVWVLGSFFKGFTVPYGLRDFFPRICCVVWVSFSFFQRFAVPFGFRDLFFPKGLLHGLDFFFCFSRGFALLRLVWIGGQKKKIPRQKKKKRQNNNKGIGGEIAPGCSRAAIAEFSCSAENPRRSARPQPASVLQERGNNWSLGKAGRKAPCPGFGKGLGCLVVGQKATLGWEKEAKLEGFWDFTGAIPCRSERVRLSRCSSCQLRGGSAGSGWLLCFLSLGNYCFLNLQTKFLCLGHSFPILFYFFFLGAFRPRATNHPLRRPF